MKASEFINESAFDDMHDFVQNETKKAKKAGDTAKYFYYTTLGNVSAMNSYETFINSSAGEEWLKKNYKQIQNLQYEMQEEERRFSYLRNGKEVNWFIPQYPKAIPTPKDNKIRMPYKNKM